MLGLNNPFKMCGNDKMCVLHLSYSKGNQFI